MQDYLAQAQKQLEPNAGDFSSLVGSLQSQNLKAMSADAPDTADLNSAAIASRHAGIKEKLSQKAAARRLTSTEQAAAAMNQTVKAAQSKPQKPQPPQVKKRAPIDGIRRPTAGAGPLPANHRAPQHGNWLGFALFAFTVLGSGLLAYLQVPEYFIALFICAFVIAITFFMRLKNRRKG